MSVVNTSFELAVHEAIAAVDDPEYPGVSIVDLGLLESIDIVGGLVRIGLIPTFSGCPALAMIADDVRANVLDVQGVDDVEVDWLRSPAWTIARVSGDARARLSSDFNVAVAIGTKPLGATSPAVECPRCGAAAPLLSMFGPSRCRSVHRCSGCDEVVEALRS